MNKIHGLLRSTRAATAVEYGLILALVLTACSSGAPAPTASQPRVVGGPLKAPLVEDPARPPAHPAPASK